MKTFLPATVFAAALGAALAAPGAFAQSTAPAAEATETDAIQGTTAGESKDPKAEAARESAKENGDSEGIDPVGSGDQALDKEEIETGGPGKPATTTEPVPSSPDGVRPQSGASTGDSAPAGLQTRRVPAADLLDYVVVNEAGEQFGDVEQVVRSDERYFVVVGAGGLLGLGENKVALPLDRMIVGADQTLVIPALTQGEMDRLSRTDAASLEQIGTDQDVPVGIIQ